MNTIFRHALFVRRNTRAEHLDRRLMPTSVCVDAVKKRLKTKKETTE